jgi:hypothetical protein
MTARRSHRTARPASLAASASNAKRPPSAAVTALSPFALHAALVTVGIALTMLFFPVLWLGGGLIGGDLYTYFLPQKQFYADMLAQGEVPWWNPLVGHGYPVIAESQTGVFYPFHLVAYWLLDVQTAWNVVHLLHYVLAFVATAGWIRVWGGSFGAQVFGATVFVYGWFPPRACLEWAILGGSYLPMCLWCIEAFLRTQFSRWLLVFSLAIGCQLLAGHYHLAFFTWLTVAGYALWRWWVLCGRGSSQRSATTTPLGATTNPTATSDSTAKSNSTARTEPGPSSAAPVSLQAAAQDGKTSPPRWLSLDTCRPVFAIVVAGVLGVLLGAVQLWPTWELKQNSQRTSINAEFDPSYGHLPPMYLARLLTPWWWHTPGRDIDTELSRMTWGALPQATNRVEAHIYVGLLPLLMALVALLISLMNRRWPGDDLGGWILAVAGLVLATGVFQPVLLHWPGFGFFRGPGRATILTTLAIAWLAARAWDHALRFLQQCGKGEHRQWSRFRWQLLGTAAWLLTVADLWWFPQPVGYAIALSTPPLPFRTQSPVRELLSVEGLDRVRLYAPGANLPTLLGTSATPVYLGLGPSAYFNSEWTLPAGEPATDFHAYSEERVAWLRQAGVTHILAFEPLERRGWPVEPVWSGFDSFLNRAWARFTEPLYLYRLAGSLGRVSWESASTSATSAQVTQPRLPIAAEVSHTGRTVRVRATVPAAGRLTLHELSLPGWTVTVNHQPGAPESASPLERTVAVPGGSVEVVWTYCPASVYYGGFVSVLAGLVWVCWMGWAVVRSRMALPRSGRRAAVTS